MRWFRRRCPFCANPARLFYNSDMWAIEQFGVEAIIHSTLRCPNCRAMVKRPRLRPSQPWWRRLTLWFWR
jgi:hypothetical protein